MIIEIYARLQQHHQYTQRNLSCQASGLGEVYCIPCAKRTLFHPLCRTTGKTARQNAKKDGRYFDELMLTLAITALPPPNSPINLGKKLEN
ncbi:MAG: hypothetical protein PUC59_10810 [Firmicutes bacterium]|nr:hypothetical protein [Bacillota bacterium]